MEPSKRNKKIHWTEPGYSTDRVRKWRAENPERQQKASRKYYKANRTRINKRQKERYSKDPKKYIMKAIESRAKNYDAHRNTQYKKKYGITLEQYEKMLTMQGGVCAICKNPPKKTRLSVEHCHRDKRVRGLACFRCNKFLLGRWKKEHAGLFRTAADYLESSFDGRFI